MPDQSPKFSVDTHLFRELGELLVGRDSTALIELVKNAYDADATHVEVHGKNLDDRKTGTIIIRDDGLGMTREQFLDGFLRIASRKKEEGSRRSPRYGRRFTGEKGIGRLAAHKLATVLKVISVSNEPRNGKTVSGIEATIRWDRVESAKTLDSIPPDAIEVTNLIVRATSSPGTTITLSSLRKKWSERERLTFVAEAHSTRPAPFLIEALGPKILREPLLFDQPEVASPHEKRAVRDSGWALSLSGDFDIGDSFWQTLAETATWVLEIDATDSKQVTYGIAPTARHAKENRAAQRAVFTHNPEDPGLHPRFQARIFIRDGGLVGQPKNVSGWLRSTYGIRVFLEGFRILPYGDRGDDWLEIDSDYSRRSRSVLHPIADSMFSADEKEDADVGLTLLTNRGYFGGIFLTQDHSRALRVLVNREGFVPDAAFYALKELVRIGVHLATRVRAAATFEERVQRRENREEGKSSPDTSGGLPGRPLRQEGGNSSSGLIELERSLDEGARLMREARQSVTSGNMTIAEAKIAEAEQHLGTAPLQAKAARDEQAIIRVLASTGTQMAAFIHELNGLLGLIQTIEETIRQLRDEWEDENPRVARKLGPVLRRLEELRRSLERQASYLSDVVTPDARRRRSQQNLNQCLDRAWLLVSHEAAKRSISLINNIPTELRSPAMFRAELMAVFSNLLTNAIKAAGKDGSIRGSAVREADNVTRIRLENTGIRVALDDAERWFRPFTSTTANVNPSLGQGMGLGLPITRQILDEYGASISFSKPSSGYSSCVEIRFGP